MLVLLVFFIFYTVHGAYSLECRTVETGHHYPTVIPFHGFKQGLVISTRVQLNNNTAHYLFPPTESNGTRCSVSWNKLWGATRCGYLTNNHQDSDRFMWRRAVSCLIFDSKGHVIGEKSNCSEANLIEMCAAAYDGGVRPYEHPGTLLKQFAIKLRVETWYILTLKFSENQTIYQLSDDSNLILETQTIDHRLCSKFNDGFMQGFYFGGVCVAPQTVSVCYDSQNVTDRFRSDFLLKNI